VAVAKNILGIDTSRPETAIGINREVITWESRRNQSEELLPQIAKLLRSVKITKEEIKGVVVNLGPGSFTGLRVGITVANGFGFGLRIPVLGVNEFDIIKKFYPKIDLIILDAKRNELFIQKNKNKPRLIATNNLNRQIKAGDRVYVDDVELIPKIHEQLKKAGTIFIPNLSRTDKMEAMLDNAKLPKTFKQVLPIYIREANITLRAKRPSLRVQRLSKSATGPAAKSKKK